MGVLIIEDDPSTRELLTRFLTGQGFDVESAPTLLEGMLRLAAKPCGVLLDLGLPDGNGRDLLKFVRDGGLQIPVAIITGFTGDEADDAVRLNPDAVFTKPVNIAELLAWVRRVCPCT
jgi:DNA-binding response OmpR family regulator